MDKYLKKTDASSNAEVSFGHTTFDLTAWAENLSTSQREQSGMASGKRETQLEPMSTKTEETAANTNPSSVSSLKSSSPGLKSESKRSSIPVSSTRRSVGSDKSSTSHHCADKPGSISATYDSSARTQTSHGAKQREKLHTSNSNRASLETQRQDHSSFSLPITSPDMKRGQSVSSGKVTSPLPHGLRNSGQQQQNRLNNSPEKKPLVRTVSAPPLQSSPGQKHFGITQPSKNQAVGE